MKKKNQNFTARALLATLLLSAPLQLQGFVTPQPSLLGSTRRAVPLIQVTPRYMNAGADDAKAQVDLQATEQRLPKNPTPVLVTALQNLAQRTNLHSITKHSKILAVVALSMTLLFSPMAADAAMSGGRMGGSFGSSSRQSYSTPSSRSYSGGSYSTRPSVTIAPIIGGGGYTPFYSPFVNPFFPGPMVYGGGPGVIAISRGPSLWDLMIFGGIAWVAWSAISNTVSQSVDGMTDAWTERTSASLLGAGTSVVQLSVAMTVSRRDDPNSILSVLERLSQTARTDSRLGIQNLTSQVALELLRRKSSIVSGYSHYKHFRDINKAQREFNTLSVKERSKFENESTSKFGGVDYSSQRRSLAAGDTPTNQATLAVVTLNLAIDGDSTKIPTIKSIQDVEEALRKIAADVKVDDCLQSAEILWTPEDRTETLTMKDVIADYPELRSV